MSLVDKLASLEPKINRARCGVCMVLETVDKKEADLLNELMSVPVGSSMRITDRQLSEALRSEGHDVSSNSVFRHRQNHMGN